ncbi:MAG: DEAD/DEAH box helicase [bacterium]|nr:DEAD/DEAH box helicase [bacterium]
MIPRPYQTEALEALHSHICEKESNPCVVIPTGGGKSALIAWIIQKWKRDAPWFRCCILAHRKELIEQNAAELNTIAPGLDVGVFSAALKRRDWNSSILYASVDSIYKKSGEFPPWDAVIVDEAHRIPFKGEGKYRSFISDTRQWNARLKVIGFTATPFRMQGGQICHKDHILNEVCYEANLRDLIGDGYLCSLRSKVGASQPKLGEVKRNSGGDYILTSLAEATNQNAVIGRAVAEATHFIRAEKRKAIVFFCVDIEHCKRVSKELSKYGIFAPYVTGKTKQDERDRIAANFKAGRLQAICNVNVYTEGFNARHIDCIVLLRPTLSAGLFSQMVGRGLRVHASKSDCLVLDFGGCIEEHGPIDLLHGAPTILVVCKQCREAFSRALGSCPRCGWVVPKKEIKRLEAKEKERRMHADKASRKSILSGQPEIHKVDAVHAARHPKLGSPDSMRVQYRCGMSIFREWICLDHPGYPGRMAQVWWRKRFGTKKRDDIMTVNEALENMWLCDSLLQWTKTITVKKEGKYYRVTDYNQPLPEENDGDTPCNV